MPSKCIIFTFTVLKFFTQVLQRWKNIPSQINFPNYNCSSVSNKKCSNIKSTHCEALFLFLIKYINTYLLLYTSNKKWQNSPDSVKSRSSDFWEKDVMDIMDKSPTWEILAIFMFSESIFLPLSFSNFKIKHKMCDAITLKQGQDTRFLLYSSNILWPYFTLNFKFQSENKQLVNSK